MRSPSVWFVLILVAFSSGCGGGLEWKGTVSGELKLTDDKGTINEKTSGSATLESGLDNRIKFSKEATLADCDIRFGDGVHDSVF